MFPARSHQNRSFILQCPLLAGAALLAFFLVPSHPRPEEPKSGLKRLARIDFAGAILLATSVTTIMLAVELASKQLRWNHPVVFGLVGTSIVCGILFLLTETYWAYEPVFPLHLLRERNVVVSYLVLGLQVSAQFIV